MRMMLPEHREEMRRIRREQARKEKPVLEQHELDEMTYILTDAIQNETPVRLTLFGSWDDEMWIGVPVIYAGALHLVVEDERRRVPMDRLIAVESVE